MEMPDSRLSTIVSLFAAALVIDDLELRADASAKACQIRPPSEPPAALKARAEMEAGRVRF